jgi:hypothetical protein
LRSVPRCASLMLFRVLAHQLHVAATRRVQAAEQMQQRALAGPRSANDGHTFANLDFEIDAEQDLDFAVALAIDLAQPLTGQNRLTHSAALPPD